MQVGNTVMGSVDDVARAPVTEPATPPTPPVVVGARRIKSVKPVYTKLARAEGIEGTILLRVFIDKTGRVTRVKVLKGLGFMLDESAQKAAMDWRYTAKTVDGQAVASSKREEVRFVLDDF
jgi:TonB family protein